MKKLNFFSISKLLYFLFLLKYERPEKKRLWHRCFPVNFAKFPGTPFFTEHLWWLLLLLEAVTKCMIVFQVSLKFNLLKEMLKIIKCHIFILIKTVNFLRKIHTTIDNEVFHFTILHHRKKLNIFTLQLPIHYIQY